MIYGYARISTPKQKISRQVQNILREYPDAEIIEEIYTGTKFQGREKLEKLINRLQPGDTVVFDEVSRMSRNAQEGFELYQKLYDMGVNLFFLKEPYINTDTYKASLDRRIELTGDDIDPILRGINEYLFDLARRQIQIAFDQAESEVEYLHRRTREGIAAAKAAGKQPGHKPGTTYETRKAKEAKKVILKHNRAFGGSLTDRETMDLAGICKTTFYKYKQELQKSSGTEGAGSGEAYANSV